MMASSALVLGGAAAEIAVGGYNKAASLLMRPVFLNSGVLFRGADAGNAYQDQQSDKLSAEEQEKITVIVAD